MSKYLRVVALAGAVALTTAGCGSQRSDREIAAAAGIEDTRVGDAGRSLGGDASVGSADVSGEAPAAPSVGAEEALTTASPAAALGSRAATPAAAGASGVSASSSGSSVGVRPARSPSDATPQPTGAAGTSAEPSPPMLGGAVAGATGKIVIGSVGSYSGIPGSVLKGGLVALQAWVQSANDAGGLKGHPVSLVVGDDGADPARHQQLVQQFVESRAVRAFVYNAEPLTGQSSVRYLTEKRVPVIGGAGGEAWFHESPMFFPPYPHGLALSRSFLQGAADLLVPQGRTRFGFLACAEVQFCRDAEKVWPPLAKNVGFEVVYQARVSIAQPSFTSECLGAKNADVEFLFVVSDGNSVSRTARDCKSIGFGGVLGLVDPAVLDNHRSDPNLEGAVIPNSLMPWFNTANPEVQRFQAAASRYASSLTLAGSPLKGWVSARLFEAAARLSPDPTTSAGILEGLWALQGETVGGTTYPHTFPRDQKAPEVSCWSNIVITKGQFTSPTSGELRCANSTSGGSTW